MQPTDNAPQLVRDTDAEYTIRAVENGLIQVNDQSLTRSFIITPERLSIDWAPQGIEEFTVESLSDLLALKPSIVILGTGRRQHFLDAALLAPFYRAQIGIEIMDSHAACRTYNVLSSEQREVVAGILIPTEDN